MDAQQQWLAAQGYVGREYVPGQYDCAHLAIDVQREVFGRHISLPAPHRLGRAGQVAQIRALRDELAVRIGNAVHGCGVLITTPLDAGPQWHIGTVLIHRGETWVLHNSAHIGSAALNRIADFARRGQRIEGFYRWK